MKIKVLAVEDEIINLKLLKAIFEAEGWDVLTAENGKDALEIARAELPDLILSDILMPVMDGYALCRQCKSDETLKHIPFVFYTATYTEPQHEQFALDIGVDRFIRKPLEPHTLVEILMDVLGEKKTVAPAVSKPLGEEMEFFRRHNEVLFGKLEQKMLDLEAANQELRALEEKYRLSFDHVTDIICMIGTDLRILSITPSVERMLGYKSQDFIDKILSDLGHIFTPESLKQAITKINLLLKGETIAMAIHEFIDRDGHVKIGEVGGSPIMRDGKTTGAVFVVRDITTRRRAEDALAEERQRLAYILEGTNVGTWEWNVQTGEMICNNRWAEIIGYTMDELAPVSIDTWVRFIHPDDLNIMIDLLDQHFKKKLLYYELEARIRHKSGDWVWVLDNGKVVSWTDDGTPLIMSGTHQDITRRKLAEEQIQHMATHDGLTDLPSLRLARDRLSMSLSMARRQRNMTAVMFLDLDEFKAVNDTFGHDAGDDVLKEVAKRLLSCIRETDTAARVGGDEFLVVATGLHDAENAVQIAENIIRLVSQPIVIDSRQTVVTASLGISLFPQNGGDVEGLIKLADDAMYEVKKSTRNGYGFAKTVHAP
ncbi:MAG: diguanylate cyclase [Deltaproteobacteria bacterium]|nr:diguanylate cyclase [Deltaproteobacteria bacterium]